MRRARNRISPTFSINPDITGSELKWVMACLLMASHFIWAFCPGERFSQTAVEEIAHAAPISQKNKLSQKRAGGNPLNVVSISLTELQGGQALVSAVCN